MERPPGRSTLRLSSRRSLPLNRSISGLAVLARYVSRKGIDVALLMADSGIKLGDLDNPDILVTPEHVTQDPQTAMNRRRNLLQEPCIRNPEKQSDQASPDDASFDIEKESY